jgi:hypothetical protein
MSGVLERIAACGDLFAPVLELRQELSTAPATGAGASS